jgi:competence ComEA-like helix-hairpin-helix protein
VCPHNAHNNNSKHPRPSFWISLFTRQERSALLFLIGLYSLGTVVMGLHRPPAEPVRLLSQKVRINQATAAELAVLRGIGSKTAQRIVKVRHQEGRFLTLRDLKQVKGVSQKMLDRVASQIRFD